ncbi:sodium:calcium antiporter [Candidatus Woesearchaeota archaeon]|nr:sodium:calcium antiporter [Candidatus Woesearchaeota archaeon]
MIVTNLLFFLGACIVLVAGGGLLVKSLSKIASFLKMSEFVVGFIIMGIATTIPELFVGIASALGKTPSLSLGNVIGSNIVNVSLILGIVVLLSRGIEIKSPTMKSDALYAFFISIVPIVLMGIGRNLSRIDGVILLGIYIIYTWWLIRARKEFRKELEERVKRWEIIGYTAIFAACLLALFLSARFVTKYGELLAIDFGMPNIMIGLFLVAIGTSLPELVFGVRAATMKHPTMALGDITGAIVSNSTLVLGVTALICPITAHFMSFLVGGSFMIVACFLFATFVESGNRLYWKEGVAMVLLYVLFIVVEFYIKAIG